MNTTLMADPQALFQDGLRALLEPDFAVVGQVADGEALVSEALRLRPEFVVTEVRLPGLSGLEAARRVLQAAAALGIATRTVAFHKYGAMQTLAIRSGAELVRFAVDSGMLDRQPHAGAA
jgi:DNA-binding NarL/FixJ family response regulator